jgi:hypothetical protein
VLALADSLNYELKMTKSVPTHFLFSCTYGILVAPSRLISLQNLAQNIAAKNEY